MASLDEPYLVTSYGVNASSSSTSPDEHFKLGVTSVIYHEGKGSKNKTGKQQSRRPVAVNTVQGNGVHLVDLSDQSPLAAFTVSPSTTFTSKAISISSEATTEQLALFASSSLASTSAASSSNSSNALPRRSRKTFVGFELDGECQLCCWTELENPDGTSVGEAIRVVKNLTNPVVAVSFLGTSILAVDKKGLVTLLDTDLQELTSISISSVACQLRRVEPASLTPVLDADGTPVKSTYRLPVVCYEVLETTKHASPKKPSKRRQSDAAQATQEQQQKVYIVYLALNTYYKKISEIGRADVPGEKIVDVIQMADRKFATLDSTGALRVVQLDREAFASISPQNLFSSSLAALSFTPSAERTINLKQDLLQLQHARLAPLSSNNLLASSQLLPTSCLLLVAPRGDQSGIIEMILWDISLGLALAQTEVTLSTPLDQSGLDSLSITLFPGSLVTLAYTPSMDPEASSQLAKRSSVHAVAFTAPQHTNLASVVGKQALTSQYIASSAAAAAQVSQATTTTKGETRTDTIFNKMLGRLEEHLGSDKPRSATEAEKVWQSWLNVDVTAPASEQNKSKAQLQMATLSSRMARHILKLALPVKGSQEVPWHIVRDLLVNKKISDSSIAGGLVTLLIVRGRWDLVKVALQTCDDIPESSLVTILSTYLQVGVSKATPKITFEQLLHLVMQAPASPAVLRSNLRKFLTAEEMRSILLVLNTWMSHAVKNASLDSPHDSKTPDTSLIVPFLQALLDAHLVTILQTESLHLLVQSISAHLLDTIKLSASLQNLRAPLEVFHKANLKAKTAESLQRKKKGMTVDQTWAAKKAHQENQLSLGDYAVESFRL